MRKVGRILLCLVAVLLSEPGRAATVTSAADNGPGTLRQAIADAPAGETIGFSITGTINLTNGELLINKNLTIQGPGASNLAIQRASAGPTADFRIFNIQAGIVSISGLTINNGRSNAGGGINNESATTAIKDCAIAANFATESGGGIRNLSSLTLSNCVIRGNMVTGGTGAGYGGGVDNQGTMTLISSAVNSNSVTGSGGTNGFGGGIRNSQDLGITNSAVSGNFASDSGGGVFNEGTLTLHTSSIGANSAKGGAGSGRGGGIANTSGTVTLDRSTVSSNTVGIASASPGQGGGIASDSGTLVLCNSTLSGNVAGGGAGGNVPHGGGIFNRIGSVTLNNSTITANVVPGAFPQDGGGLFNSAGVVEAVKNTILAGNSATVDIFNGPQGDVFSGGFNFFGFTNGIIMSAQGDRFNFTASQLVLGPLQNNGGPTFTHALLCGSPAINAGGGSGCDSTDQRGFSRIVGGTIDIGSYEFSNVVPTVTCPSPTSAVAVGGAAIVTLRAQVTDTNAQPLNVVWFVDGSASQTNQGVATTPSTPTDVIFTGAFTAGVHAVQIQATDPDLCLAACSTIVYVTSSQNPCNALILGLTDSPPAMVSGKSATQQ